MGCLFLETHVSCIQIAFCGCRKKSKSDANQNRDSHRPPTCEDRHKTEHQSASSTRTISNSWYILEVVLGAPRRSSALLGAPRRSCVFEYAVELRRGIPKWYPPSRWPDMTFFLFCSLTNAMVIVFYMENNDLGVAIDLLFV